jgi:hypothetical protein
MTRFSRFTIGAVLAGVLTVSGLAGAAPASATSGSGAAPMLWLEYGPYDSLEVCDIVRTLHGPPTSGCTWKFYDWAHYGWYFGSNH